MTSTTRALPSLGSVEGELARVFAAKRRLAAAYGPWFEQLWGTAAAKATGGKLLRPRLFLAALDAIEAPEATGENDPGRGRADARPEAEGDAAMRVAVALELLHYSFLLHDDVIDGDAVRRGEPNLIAVLAGENPPGTAEPAHADGDAPVQPPDARRLHWARSCGILMGDLLLAEVHQLLAGLDGPAGVRRRLLALLDHAVTESVAGEQLDVGLGDGVIDPDLAGVLRMSRLKTATYTFELPLRAAAAVAGADPRLDAVLAQAGRHLGLAFQLQDDLLSTFGDPSAHGKDPYSDLREGKETVVIAHARMTSAWPSIEPLFGSPALTPEGASEMRSLLVDCGAESFAESLVDDQLRALHELLAERDDLVPARLAAVVSALSTRLEGRTA